MPFLISFFTWFGTAFTWLIKEFIPTIAKRFGLGAILGAIQKGISVLVVSFVITIFGVIINFALNMFTAFYNLILYINSIGNGGTWGSCFIYMLNVSGISLGIQMAAPFYLGILVFFFIYIAYKITFLVLKTISDETSKTIESVK